MANYQQLFESAPDAYLVLSPNEDFTIIGVNDAFLGITMTERANIIGQPLFTIFPQNPDDVKSHSIKVLRQSLEDAIGTKERQILQLHRYDIRRSKSMGGDFEKRHWRICNVPVVSAAGK